MKKPEGIRIRHETIRPPAGESTTWVAVVDLSEPTPNSKGLPSPVCAICQVDHGWYKVRHVQLDADGYGIVSEGVWEGLKKSKGAAGFTVTNTVTNPPTIELVKRRGAEGFDLKIRGADKVPHILSP